MLDRRALWAVVAPQVTRQSLPESSSEVSCLHCGLVHAVADLASPPQKCARCHGRLARRKIDSVSRTWALVITGALLYIPANAYPALTVISFGRGMPSTILGGVIELMNGQDWPLALLIFTASVAVPLLKLLGLTALLLSRQWRLRSRCSIAQGSIGSSSSSGAGR